MTLRSLSVFALVTCSLLLTARASAHDTSLQYDYVPPPVKTKPANCDQLADNERYSTNMVDPDIKALKAKCDAEKKAAVEPPPTKANQPRDEQQSGTVASP